MLIPVYTHNITASITNNWPARTLLVILSVAMGGHSINYRSYIASNDKLKGE